MGERDMASAGSPTMYPKPKTLDDMVFCLMGNQVLWKRRCQQERSWYIKYLPLEQYLGSVR